MGYVNVPSCIYRLTHSIVPARLSVCHLYMQLHQLRGWSPSASVPLSPRCVALRGPILGQRGLMRNYRAYIYAATAAHSLCKTCNTNWIPPGDANLSFMELTAARCVDERMFDVTFGGLRSSYPRGWQMKISSWPRCCREKRAETANT